jgi:aryl-alcohol dehydrogenase-like predicted oxidoreductase
MTFGMPADQATATRVVDRCIEDGVNFMNTADLYQRGVADTMLGEAMRGWRHKLVVATKVRGKMGEGKDESGLSKRAIVCAIEDSLRRLQTDYVDLYYLHQPNCAVPIEETLDAIEELVKVGRVLCPAPANYSGWQVCEMLWIARERSYTPPYISHPMYNLLARGIEREYLPMAKKYGVSLIVYNPLAGGMLTGKIAMAGRDRVHLLLRKDQDRTG